MERCAVWRDALLEEKQEQINGRQAKLESLSVREQEQQGLCVRRLHVTNRKRDLGGRHIFTLGSTRCTPTGDQAPLPATRISVGDVVAVGTAKDGIQGFASGVVSRISSMQIQVAVDEGAVREDQAWAAHALIVRQLSDTVTFGKLTWTIDKLDRGDVTCRRLYQLLIEESAPALELGPEVPVHPFNKSLNESQLGAVAFALRRHDIAVIHGPPGTGKTTTVVELILQLVKGGKKVLVAAASNMAVDNLVERLIAYNANVLRIGHPARLLASVKEHSLDSLLNQSQDMSIVRGIYEEIASLRSGSSGKREQRASRHQTRRDIKDLRRDAQEREKRLVQQLLSSADVVCGTTTTVCPTGVIKYLPKDHFDVAVVDEAGQALEPAAWAAVMQAPRCVLAGDHLQLPPTITSAAAAASGLSTTLLERVVQTHGDTVTRMLDTQYRMHAAIQAWSSQHLYDARLLPDTSVAAHLLSDLPNVQDTQTTAAPVVLVDTAGSNLMEASGEDDISKCNEGEAHIVVEHVASLLSMGVRCADVGVITPYNLQVETIRNMLSARNASAVEVSSVDGFQGREKEAVVMSLVRSNPDRIVGFLRDYRRINVAVTRARRHLCIVCDSNTVTADKHISSLIDHLNSHALVRTVHDYEEAQALLATAAATAKPKRKQQQQQSKKEHDSAEKEQRNVLRRSQLEAKIVAFLKGKDESSRDTLEFPTTLNSYERMLVHDICADRGLVHESVGEADQRRVVITLSRAAKARRDKAKRQQSKQQQQKMGKKEQQHKDSGSQGTGGGLAAEEEEEEEEEGSGNSRGRGQRDRGQKKAALDAGGRDDEAARPSVAMATGWTGDMRRVLDEQEQAPEEDGKGKGKGKGEGEAEAAAVRKSGGTGVKLVEETKATRNKGPGLTRRQEAAEEHQAQGEGEEETDIQRMLRQRRERLEAERAERDKKKKKEQQRQQGRSGADKQQSTKNKNKKKNSKGYTLGTAGGGRGVSRPLSSSSSASASVASSVHRRRRREADVDTLAAAIENRTTMPSQLDTVLPQENRLQRNPFLDAAAYVRAGNVERGPKPAQPSKADVKRDQLKKKLQQNISTKSSARSSQQSSDKKGSSSEKKGSSSSKKKKRR